MLSTNKMPRQARPVEEIINMNKCLIAPEKCTDVPICWAQQWVWAVQSACLCFGVSLALSVCVRQRALLTAVVDCVYLRRWHWCRLAIIRTSTYTGIHSLHQYSMYCCCCCCCCCCGLLQLHAVAPKFCRPTKCQDKHDRLSKSSTWISV